MNNNVYKKAQCFIYRNARPLDLAIWRYHFEGGSRKDVVDVLSFYQNSDGGFAYALEPDCWNTNSTPIATWKAIGVLKDIGIDENEQIVKRILNYLDSGKDFGDGKWFTTVKSNNDYPHAVWWEHRDNVGNANPNPTISLAGFALKYADKNSALYKKAADIATFEAKAFIAAPVCDMHVTPMYMEFYEYCASIDGFDLFDLAEYKNALYTAVKNTVCADVEKWFKEYVCTPSVFYSNSKLIFDILDADLCKKEGERLLAEQLDDGSYPILWLWHNDFKEYFVSANWWKSYMLCVNMQYLKDLTLI